MKILLVAIRIFLTMTLLLGLRYPTLITFAGKRLFPYQANGSLIVRNNKIIGSYLIAQEFSGERYFHSRPSAANYDASNSGASNFGPTNEKFIEQVNNRVSKLKAAEHLDPNAKIPPDLVTASSSGLDPHITVPSAMLQVTRIAKVRQLNPDLVRDIIQRNAERRFMGTGEPFVNVLKLNLELDAIK